ncbi:MULTISPECIES: hypothetical protein [Kitasatospora]|uniref:Uncharacterized protein n=1 Tax=Kitasatospora setae (strain ATCC 33774 / DSM 43861 / JCM 3304 / KCC A-0304 / NBRC 14216 / KM-6054) TaxID=452652 RepID=E4N3V1_KITSK|nr:MULTISPECIES: hypothetical protein [Kitasatospora]BAJ31582.1 hypothetical protein KSE_58110 [Kitasatospora setae KM-6054]
MTRFRRLVPPLALSLVSLGALVTSGGSARAADPPAVVCTTTATQHYSPGLTLVSRPTRITASATYACTGAGSVDTARLGFDYTVDAGCLPTSSPVTTGISILDWNEGPDSEITSTFVVTRPAGQTVGTSVGTVTAGQFNGYLVHLVGTYPGSDPLACATPQGVTSSQGELVLTLTQPF